MKYEDNIFNISCIDENLKELRDMDELMKDHPNYKKINEHINLCRSILIKREGEVE